MQAIESKTFNKKQARQARQEAAKAAIKPIVETAATPQAESTAVVPVVATVVPVTTVATSSKAPKSISILLQAPAEGPLTFKLATGTTIAVVEALIGSYRTKTGWRTFVTLYDAKYKKGTPRTGVRGSTTTETSLAVARAKVEAMSAALVAKGLVRPIAKPLGLVAKDDAFTMDNLPDPVK